MRYVFLGDIHANLSALESVLAAAHAEQPDVLVSVGDVVGYGAAPSECIRLLRDQGVVVVKGNHDAACTGQLDDRCFNGHARTAARWTRSVLDEDELGWLAQLPYTVELEHCNVTHGTLDRPELFGYVQTTADADPSLDAMTRPACFVGHTHVPVVMLRLRERPDRTAYTHDPEVDLRDVHRCLVNVGSVGQPRDENPCTGYVVFDSDAPSVRFERLDYDVQREADRIRSAGLPRVLADRLFLGL
jgi:predicted phosphodiesterase